MTKDELAQKLEALSTDMLDIANQMIYFGGFDDKIVSKGNELQGASMIVKEWIENIKDNNNE